MAQIQERYGTESEQPGDKQKIQSIWNRAPSAYEGQKIIVLPYAQYITTTMGLGMFSPQQYKINSIFDPDLTGAGTQPLGRDTWVSIYNYYKVLEAHVTMKVTLLNNDTSGGQTADQVPSLVGWFMDLSANPPSTLNTWLMTSQAGNTNQQQIFSNIRKIDPVTGRGSKTETFTYKWDASQMDTSILDNGKDEWTPVGSDPDIQNYFSFLHYNPGVTSHTRTFAIHTEIKYLVAFKQLNRALLHTVN